MVDSTAAEAMIRQPANGPGRAVRVPACYSSEIVIDYNRARQLLVNSEEVIIDSSGEGLLLRFPDGTSHKLVRRRSVLSDNELALFVPRKTDLDQTSEVVQEDL